MAVTARRKGKGRAGPSTGTTVTVSTPSSSGTSEAMVMAKRRKPGPTTTPVGIRTTDSMLFGAFNTRGEEMKYLDTVKANADLPGGMPAIWQTSINLIQEGVAENNRIGRKVVLKKVSLRGKIKLQPSTVTTDSADIVRILLILDKQCNGGTPANTEVFKGSGVAALDFYAFNNLDNVSRFVVLMDKWITLNAMSTVGGNSDTAEVFRMFKFNKKGLNIPLDFAPPAGSPAVTALAQVKSNNLMIFASARDGGGVDAPVRMEHFARIRFTDA